MCTVPLLFLQEVHEILKDYELKYCFVDRNKGTGTVWQECVHFTVSVWGGVKSSQVKSSRKSVEENRVTAHVEELQQDNKHQMYFIYPESGSLEPVERHLGLRKTRVHRFRCRCPQKETTQ